MMNTRRVKGGGGNIDDGDSEVTIIRIMNTNDDGDGNEDRNYHSDKKFNEDQKEKKKILTEVMFPFTMPFSTIHLAILRCLSLRAIWSGVSMFSSNPLIPLSSASSLMRTAATSDRP